MCRFFFCAVILCLTAREKWTRSWVVAEQLNVWGVDQERQIESAADVASFLGCFVQPSVSIVDKKGVGITKRVIFFVPTKGPDSPIAGLC